MSDEVKESPQSEQPKVKVSDRRRFDAEGQARDPSEVDPEPAAAKAAQGGAGTESPPSTPAEQATGDGPEPEAGPRPPIPPASFELLVLSLAMQAQMELGLGEPQEGQIPNLDIARHTIDLLAILQQKTKGNLSLEEQRLLDNTLTELRFRYVQALEQINKRAKA